MNFVVYLLVLIACASSFGLSQTIDPDHETAEVDSPEDDIVSNGMQAVHGIVNGVWNTVKDGLSKIIPHHEHQQNGDRGIYLEGILDGVTE